MQGVQRFPSGTATQTWDEIYSGGGGSRYPYSEVVAFVSRFATRKSPDQTRVLELGCGRGNNLWFLLREGFRAVGIDISSDALAAGSQMLRAEGHVPELLTGTFTALPFVRDSFDVVIDRGSLVCCPPGWLAAALDEVKRVLNPGGRFLFTPYRDTRGTGLELPTVDDESLGDLLRGWHVLEKEKVSIEGPRPLEYWRIALES